MNRDMKNAIKILLLSILCMATKCQDKESENCHTSIGFFNNTDNNLCVRSAFPHSYFFPTPLDIKNLSPSEGKYKIKSSEQNNRRAISSGGCYEDKFYNDGDTFFVFIFDAAVVENTLWEVVAREYLVLKRYDLTLEDLQRLNWKITYPPMEAMKDVKQYPPYGE